MHYPQNSFTGWIMDLVKKPKKVLYQGPFTAHYNTMIKYGNIVRDKKD